MTIKDLSGQQIKGYVLHEMIGAGGFGAVYRAYQPLIKRDVAMKIILPEFANHPEFIRRFEFEAQLVARLEHLHIVALYDYWRDPQGAYLIMRWLRGGSLRALLKKGPPDIKTTVRIVDQIASALGAAHRRGVVHRDIKPDNILFDDEGNAYLADFGIAKNVRETTVDSTDDEDEGGLTGSPFYLAPEQAQSQPVSAQTDLYSLGIVIYEMLAGQPPFLGDKGLMAILLQHVNDPVPPIRERRPDLPLAVEAVIQRATAKDPDARYLDALTLANDFRRALVAAEPELIASLPRQETTEMDDLLVITKPLMASTLIIIPEEAVTNPYKGLQAFEEADAADFFGRAALIQRLVDRLAEPDPLARFLAVIGPSGSGKSSVVKAGVIPALRQGALLNTQHWFMAEMVPGSDPFRELSAALLGVAAAPPEDLGERLRTDENALAEVIEQILPPEEECGLVLTIDQFEEVFTLVNDEAQRAHFLNLLLKAVSTPSCRFRLIITLRADFYDRPLLYPGFGELVRLRNEVVLPLSTDEMRQAIVGPAERIGVAVESGLVGAMIAEIGEQPGALPLMQYALTELFDRREGQVMTLKAYNNSGGVRGALARRAEELYQESTPEIQATMRQVFLRMVEVGEGQDDTRRRASQLELMELVENPDLVMELLNKLGKYRLLTFDHDPDTRVPVVSVAHEALIRQWERMRGWLDDSREDLLVQRRIALSNHEWRRQNQDTSFLATGTRLDQFEALHQRQNVALTSEEIEYVESSIAQRVAQQEAERRRAEHEAMLEKRSRDRLRWLAVVMAGAAVIALVLASVAFAARQTAAEQRDKAERSAEISSSLALVANAQAELDKHNNELAIALALEANEIPDPPREAFQILADSALKPGAVRVFNGHTDSVNGVAFSPDGQTALSGSRDSTLILWDVTTGEIVRRFEGHTDSVLSIALSPDGQTALSASADMTLILWDIQTGENLHRFEGHTERILAVAFSPDGKTALSGSEDNVLMLWDIENRALLRRFEREPADDETDMDVYAVAFSPDGQTALAGYLDSRLLLWNLETGEIINDFETNGADVVTAVAFSPDGALIFAAWGDTVHVLDVATGAETMALKHGGIINSIVPTPDGKQVFAAGNDMRVYQWSLATGTEMNRFVGHTDFISQVALNGNWLLTASGDQTMRLWSLVSGAELRRFVGHDDGITSVNISPDQTRFVTSSIDGTARIWDIATGEILTTFTGHTSFLMIAVFSPDGKYVLSSDYTPSVILWDAETGEIVRTLEGLVAPALGLAFSPDGTRAVTGLEDNTVIVWDLETGEQEYVLEGHTNSIFGVAVSPDGRWAASGGADAIVILWNLADGTEARRLTEHDGSISNVAFSPDGQALLATSGNVLEIWDVNTGDLIRRFEGHTGGVWRAVFSPDGARLLSAAADNTLRVWDTASGRELRRIDHGPDVWTATFGPAGETAISGDSSGTIFLWDAQPLTLAGLIEWTRAHRYVPPFSCLQQQHYHLELTPECQE
jgi:WD40 repeat protein